MALSPAETKLYQEWFRRTKDDIREFARMVGFVPYGGQRDFCDMVERLTLDPTLYPKQIGVKAGTGVGKTRTMAFLALWRLWRWPGTKVLNTAPTERQCRVIFFSEIASLVAASPLLGKMMEVSEARAHFIGEPNWQMFAATAGDENALRGIHHEGLMIAVEELTGIKPNIISALLRTCSQRENLFAAIFNPDQTNGLAYEMFNSKKKFWPWNLTIDKLQISKEAPHIVDPRILEVWRQEHGEDSDFWLVGVLGQFPSGAKDTIITNTLINKCVATPMWQAIRGLPGRHHARVISVDFARYGGDENTIYARSGNAIVRWKAMIDEPREAAFAAMRMQDELGWDDESTLYILDGIGIGQGVIVYFEEAGKNIKLFRSQNPSPIEGFKNEASAAWFNAASRMKYQNVSIPNDEILHEQLRTRAYHSEDEIIRVETKKEYKKRGFTKSPDRGDGLIMAFSEEEDIIDNEDALTKLSHMYKAMQGQSQAQATTFGNRLIY